MDGIYCSNDRVLYPLTHPQKRIWYMEKIYPGTSLYNIGGPVRIKGAVDFSILEEAINLLVKRNEGLRLRFIEENGQVKQYVSDYEKIKLDLFDFRQYENPEKEFRKWVDKQAEKPFDIENRGLFYFALFKLSDNDNGYLAKFHHIISDGWSINIMTQQICDSYMKLINGEEIDNYSGCESYTGYIDIEKKYISSDRFQKNKVFWNEKFRELPEVVSTKSSDSIEGKRKTFELEQSISAGINKFSAENKYSLNAFFVTLYLIYLYKTTGQKDIIIGTPVLNRSGKKEKSMFGMFTSTMPFRYCVDGNSSITETMSEVSEQLKECYFNQKYPYELLVQDLELKKKGYGSLFNVCINYYNTKLNSELNGFPIENVEFYNGKQAYSFQLVIKEWSESLLLDFDYKVNDYADEQINEMYIRLLNLTNQIIKNPSEKIGNLSLLSEEENNKLVYLFNATQKEYPKEKTIYQLFEDEVERSADKVAVVFNSIEITYKELNEKANGLAGYLIKRGIKREKIVGLATSHSIETVIAILGILKAGGAYLPIDPTYPVERISYMLEDSKACFLLTNLEIDKGLNFDGDIIDLKDESIYNSTAVNPGLINKPDDLAYVIYTSGSTGRPKGVMIEHRGLVNYIWWAKKVYVKDRVEVFPLYSSLSFDLTVTSIFTPLISGSKIIVYDGNSEDEEYVLYRIMRENKSTVIKLTPAHLSLLKDMDNKKSTVKRFIVGGDDLKVKLAQALHKSFGGNIEIYNEYGPTETVVGCMIHKFDYEKDTGTSVPIGIPAENVQIYILDGNLNPVPADAEGELYISGDGVARGYLNRPELTRERFVANPFLKGKRMYKTGDSGRLLKNGKIEYTGRLDYQVKIHGHRIETGEIEKCLLNHEGVREAVVLPFQDRNNEKYLCAYIVPTSEISEQGLREYLKGYLPDYMLPLYFINVDKIPLTVNGKINIALLPKPDVTSGEEEEFVPSRTENEKELVTAISEVLNLERVSLRQNFYRLGGDSIKAIQIASKLNDKGCRLKVKDIMSNPVIGDMALHIEKTGAGMVDTEPCKGSIKHTPITAWFFGKGFADPSYYNQSVLLQLKSTIDVKALETVFENLVRHHDILRANYNKETGELFYNNDYLEQPFHIKEYDLSQCESYKQSEAIEKISEELKASLELEKSILIKACVFCLSQNERFLLITAHHLIVDGVSWRIILEDIYTMLKQLSNSSEIVLPEKTHSYQKWAELLQMPSNNMAELKGSCKPGLCEYSYPLDFDKGHDLMEFSSTVKGELTDQETRKLLLKANSAYNTNTNDLLIVALAKTISEQTKVNNICLEIESHGRKELAGDFNFTRTVGWFTEMDIFSLEIEHGELSQVIKAIKNQLRENSNKIDRTDCPKKQIRFNYLGDLGTNFENDLFCIRYEDTGLDCSRKNLMTALIDINAMVVNDRLKIEVLFSDNKFKKVTMETFLASFVNNLKQVIEHCCNRKTVEFTTSDFDTIGISQTELDSLFKLGE